MLPCEGPIGEITDSPQQFGPKRAHHEENEYQRSELILKNKVLCPRASLFGFCGGLSMKGFRAQPRHQLFFNINKYVEVLIWANELIKLKFYQLARRNAVESAWCMHWLNLSQSTCRTVEKSTNKLHQHTGVCWMWHVILSVVAWNIILQLQTGCSRKQWLHSSNKLPYSIVFSDWYQKVSVAPEFLYLSFLYFTQCLRVFYVYDDTIPVWLEKSGTPSQEPITNEYPQTSSALAPSY